MKRKSSFKLLIAEDDIDDQYLISAALKKHESKIDHLALDNGKKVIEYMKSLNAPGELPDLIIVDLNMPIMDGESTLKKLKSEDKWKHIPVVVFTTSAAPSDIKSSLLSGANSFVIKPLVFEEYVSTICGICDYWFKIVELYDAELSIHVN